MNKLLKTSLVTALMIGGILGAAAPSADAELHFALSKSAPVEDASVDAVTEIRLWFTEEPEDGTTSIRLIDSSEEAIHTAEVTQDPEDERVFFVTLHEALAAGSYTVAWRGMGGDGHVVRESFSFTVTGQ